MNGCGPARLGRMPRDENPSTTGPVSEVSTNRRRWGAERGSPGLNSARGVAAPSGRLVSGRHRMGDVRGDRDGRAVGRRRQGRERQRPALILLFRRVEDLRQRRAACLAPSPESPGPLDPERHRGEHRTPASHHLGRERRDGRQRAVPRPGHHDGEQGRDRVQGSEGMTHVRLARIGFGKMEKNLDVRYYATPGRLFSEFWTAQIILRRNDSRGCVAFSSKTRSRSNGTAAARPSPAEEEPTQFLVDEQLWLREINFFCRNNSTLLIPFAVANPYGFRRYRDEGPARGGSGRGRTSEPRLIVLPMKQHDSKKRIRALCLGIE